MPGDPRYWKDLLRQSRREVDRLARKGARRPDPAVARVAYEWAVPRASSRTGIAAVLGVDVLFDALLGGTHRQPYVILLVGRMIDS